MKYFKHIKLRTEETVNLLRQNVLKLKILKCIILENNHNNT